MLRRLVLVLVLTLALGAGSTFSAVIHHGAPAVAAHASWGDGDDPGADPVAISWDCGCGD